MTTLALLMLLGHAPGNQESYGVTRAAPIDPQDVYVYGSPAFDSFVNDSFRTTRGAPKFYAWLSGAYRKKAYRFPDKPKLSLTDYMGFKRREIASIRDPAKRASKERAFAASLHKMVKGVLPAFSLDKGFEFRNTVSKGQRQCFLQSVMLGAMLQAGGVPAGVAMVNRNFKGQETNNKHAVCFARLSNGHDLIVDASEPQPFARQQGLFVDTVRGYRYVQPVYDTDSSILAYRSYSGRITHSVDQIRPLNCAFIRSQFEYYRGERTNGGVMATQKSEGGVAAAKYHLERSVELCPENPLAMYMLGKVLSWEHRNGEARRTLEQAMWLYAQAGWVPPDERQALVQSERSGA